MMRLPSSVPLVAIVLAVLALACPGQGEATTLPPSTPLSNADFENGTAGDAPPGWDVRAGETGKVVLDHTTAFAGEQCATITVDEDAGADRLSTNLMQSIDAKPYQGKRVRFRAAVQVPGLPDDTLVQLWMRVDQPKDADGKSQASSFDNMKDRPIKNATWAHHDIVLDVAPDAARINCGIFVIGKGKAWIDDASLSLVGDNVPTTPRKPEPKRPPAPKAKPAATAPVSNQDATGLNNGDFESDAVGGAPSKWRFSSTSGATASVTDDGPSAGEHCVYIDASDGGDAGRKFTNLSQSFSAKPWQGKRVTFRAAVRVGDLKPTAKVQLWMRVDQPKNEDGTVTHSAFDNMDPRPIKNELWAHHEIVLDVKEDADRIIIGMFVIGEGKAWLDDVSFAVAAQGKKTTGSGGGGRSGRQRDPRVTRALAEAANAPQQPFWTWWLILPALAVGLFCFAMWPLRRVVTPDKDSATMAAKPSIARWFALEFTIIYWLLYCLPRPLRDVFGSLGSGLQASEEQHVLVPVGEWLSQASGWLMVNFAAGRTWVVEHAADLFFGIPKEQLVPPNGSGDTTYSYIANFTMFVLALVVAGGLAFVRRRPVSFEASMDLLRTFLRYVLAFYMLGYGLAKTGMASNQFPIIGEWQLNKTWGESTPMNVLWSFMGASRPYTIFGGLCEVMAAVLLIWRRTGTLGSLVALAVMTNVMLLNYCYDVPVKLLSSHLVIMAVVICTPDVVRLTQALVLQRTTLAAGLPSVWLGTWQRWTRLTLKTLIIVFAFGAPIYNNMDRTCKWLAEQDELAGDQGPPEKSKHKLVNRGYRWINEVPYNR